METIIKPYKFKDSDPALILLFLELFKNGWDSDSVSEGVATWLLHFFMVEPPTASLTIQMKLSKDRGDKLDEHRSVEEQECMYA